MPFGERQFENPPIPSTEKPEKVEEKELTTEKKIEPAEEIKIPEKRESTEVEDNLKLEQIREELKKLQEAEALKRAPERVSVVEGETKKMEKESEQEFLRNEIDRTSRIAREFMGIDQERQNRRLNPLFGLDYSRQYIKDLIPTRPSEDQKLTKDDLRRTENKVLGFTLEVADQILQPKPKRMNVREDLESLKQVYSTLRRGEQLYMDTQKNRPEDIQTILRQMLIEGKSIPEEKIKPEQIRQLEGSIGNARGGIGKRIETLERYFRR